MYSRSLGRLSTKSTTLLLCDMQEKFRSTIFAFPQILSVAKRVLDGSRLLEVPVIATEQYPKGLGKTVAELNLPALNVPVFEKTCFSMACPKVDQHLKASLPHVKSVLLCGIEAHACIFQTVLDLLERRYEVHLIVDAISSRSQTDRAFALRRLEQAGAFLTTAECALFELLKDSAHPKFREVQKLFMETSADSGLLQLKF